MFLIPINMFFVLVIVCC